MSGARSEGVARASEGADLVAVSEVLGVESPANEIFEGLSRPAVEHHDAHIAIVLVPPHASSDPSGRPGRTNQKLGISRKATGRQRPRVEVGEKCRATR